MPVSRLLLAAAAAGALAAAPPARASGPLQRAAAPRASSPKAGEAKGAQVVELSVTSEGFVPARVTVKRGRPVKLVVTRKTERTCATEIVMKDFGVERALPLGEPVAVTVTPPGPGSYRYACGMDMIAGVLQVE